MAEQAPAETNWLQLASEAYRGSTNYFDTSIRRQIEQDIRQFNSEHPQGSKYLHESYRTRSRLFRPKTRATIRKNEAVAAEALFSTTDLITVSPQDESDMGQRANAAFWNEVLQHRLTKTIPWFVLAIGAYQESQAVGVVCSHQHWVVDQKRKKDEPAVDLVPPENIRFDPGAKWWDVVGTSPYIIHMIPMYVKDVRARMQAGAEGQAPWKLLAEAEIRAATESYSDPTRQTREGQQRQDPKGTENANVPAFALVWVHRVIMEMDGEDVVYYTLGEHHLLSHPVPLSEEVAHGKRPYVLGFCAIEAHKTYPGGVARLTRDVQQEINDVTNLRIDNVKFVLNKRYFVKRGRQVDVRSLTRNVPGSATMMEDPSENGDVRVVDTSDVTSSSYQEQDRLNLDFDDVAGAFSPSSVQSNRKLNETVGGMNILTTNANQVGAYQLKTWVETWVEPVLRQLLLLEQYYETDMVILTLAGKKAQLVQKFGVDQLTDELMLQELTLSVGVGMGTTNPTEKVNLLLTTLGTLRDVLEDGGLEQRGLLTDEVVNEVFGKLGYSDGSRFFDMEGKDLRIQTLENKIAELQKALDAKMPPELLAASIKKIEAEISAMLPKAEGERAKAVKTGVEATFSALQAAQVLAAVPETAPIADGIIISAGGQDPNYIAPETVPAGISTKPLYNPRTAIEIQQAGPAVTPGTGEQAGIETLRPDSLV